MAVELSKAKDSVKEAAMELDLDSSRLSRSRNNPSFNGGKAMMDIAGLSEEQRENQETEECRTGAGPF